jgi:two-component system, NtrC family, response regulator AtoC
MSPDTPRRKQTVYIVDDEPDQIALLTAQLERSGRFTTEGFSDPQAALEKVSQDPPDGIVCDLMMPETSGLDFTRLLRGTHPFLPVIIATGKGSEDDADACFAAGATDFVTKPVDPGTLIARIRKALGDAPAMALLEETARARFDPDGIIGSHPRIDGLRGFIANVAAVPTVSALLLGESGTGKNLVARAIHARSEASAYRFVEVNCAALPANLLEAELFGYEKGAFTDARQTKKGLVEEADGGTLFLDEVGSMPLELQAKLLTFLESRLFRRVGSTKDLSVDLRIVTATNADLERQVRDREFREDLFYRLNVASHTLPPLREITSDIRELTLHFVKRAAEHFRRPVPDVEMDGIRRLEQYAWPGNIRELRNVVERTMIFSGHGPLRFGPESLATPSGGTVAVTAGGADGSDPASGEGRASSNGQRAPVGPGLLPVPRGLTLEEVERMYIGATLEEMDGKVNETAERLGVTRKVLWNRRKKLGLL